MAVEMDKFYGCYLLVCENPRFKGRTYIGFTVDPNRRALQHNMGSQKGGAHRTSGRGPWEMVLIIHGFPNMISALKFEWVWQHPEKSTKLRGHKEPTLRKRGGGYRQKVHIASLMLSTPPWSFLPLTVRWLSEKYSVPLDQGGATAPPVHVPVTFGHIVSSSKQRKAKKFMVEGQENVGETTRCSICEGHLLESSEESIKCIHKSCGLVSHMICLARNFTSSSGQLLPVSGKCPSCRREALWGDLIRAKNGYSVGDSDTDDDEELDGACWTQALFQTA